MAAQRSSTAPWMRAACCAAGITLLLGGVPTAVWAIATHLVTLPTLSGPPLEATPWGSSTREQLATWAWHTYHHLRLGVSGVERGLVVCCAVLVASWCVLVWWSLCDLALLTRRGLPALRAQTATPGPRGWVTGLLAGTLLLSTAATAHAGPSASETTATAPRTPGTPDEWTVQPGDTLSSIAEATTGTPHTWPRLAAANQLPHPDELTPGMRLHLPPRLTADRDLSHLRHVTVRPGDTLTDLAATHLGTPHRWREIHHLNHGRLQPDGGHLDDPDDLRPGWHLGLPDTSPEPPAPSHDPPAPDEPSHSPAPPPQPQEPARVRDQPEVSPVAAAATGAAASAALTAAAAATWHRRRRHHPEEPGPSAPPTPAPGPARHLPSTADVSAETTPDADNPPDEPRNTPDDTPDDRDQFLSAEATLGDGRTAALHHARHGGLGLIGPGAPAALRALLVQLLSNEEDTTLVLPDEVATLLVGMDAPPSETLHVTDDLQTACSAALEHQPQQTAGAAGTQPVLVAAASPPAAEVDRHLAPVARVVPVLLLGHLAAPAGTSIRVSTDGHVTATRPHHADLQGTRLFTLDNHDTRTLTELVTDSAPTAPTSEPHTPATHEPHAASPAVEPDGAEPAPTSDPDTNAPSPPETPGPDRPTDSDHSGYTPLRVSNTFETPDQHAASRHASDKHRSTGHEGTLPASLTDAEPCPLPDRPWTVTVFGPVTLTWHNPHGQEHDLTHALSPKHKALLVFLALHPRGTTRHAVRDALWPDTRGRRPFNAFYASLSQLRKACSHATDGQAGDLVTQHDEHIALAADRVDVDYWHLHHADHERRTATTDDARLAACSRIASIYRGRIAEDLSAPWLEGPRQDAHRTVLDALASMAVHHRGHDPQRQLQILEHARSLDPHNEDIYRDILRVQAELGLTDAINRTVQMLTTNLADIDERPTPNTLTLARALQARQHRADH